MNIAGVNSFFIWRSSVQDAENRRQFLKTVGMELFKNHMIMRAMVSMIPLELHQTVIRLPIHPALPVNENEPRSYTIGCSCVVVLETEKAKLSVYSIDSSFPGNIQDFLTLNAVDTMHNQAVQKKAFKFKTDLKQSIYL